MKSRWSLLLLLVVILLSTSCLVQPDTSGLPCENDSYCAGLTCEGGYCGGKRTRKDVCQEGMVDCKGSCVNTKTDLKHCGACGASCKVDEACKVGKCESLCSNAETHCSNTCVDTQTDSKHCGACDKACTGLQVCERGTCKTPAPIVHLQEIHIGTIDYLVIKNRGDKDLSLYGYTIFADDPKYADSNYSFQDITIKAGQSLYLYAGTYCPFGLGKECINTYQGLNFAVYRGGGTYLCKGACSSNTVVDYHAFQGNTLPPAPLHGVKFGPKPSTGITASEQESLAFLRKAVTGSYPHFKESDWTVGKKNCVAEHVSCGGRCRNLKTHMEHCGACGVKCTQGKTCQEGVCKCPYTQTSCSGLCVDKEFHSSHCGTCGNTCNAGLACWYGACKTPPPPPTLYFKEIHIGVDFIALKNGGSKDINLKGYVLLLRFDKGGLSEQVLGDVVIKAGQVLFLHHADAGCPSKVAGACHKLQKGIPHGIYLGGSTYLCKGACSSSTVLDYHEFSSGTFPPVTQHGVRFYPIPSSGIHVGNQLHSSFLRWAVNGRYPNFLQSDWRVGPRSK